MTAANDADRLLLGGLLAVVLAITVYVASAPPAAIYSVGAQRAVAEFARYSTRELRVKGLLVPGSVHKHHSGAECGLDFSLLDQGQSLRVSYDGCALPDTFCDLPDPDGGGPFSEVQAQGRLVKRDWRVLFVANQLIMKCPAKYYSRGAEIGSRLCRHYCTGDFCPICDDARHGH